MSFLLCETFNKKKYCSLHPLFLKIQRRGKNKSFLAFKFFPKTILSRSEALAANRAEGETRLRFLCQNRTNSKKEGCRFKIFRVLLPMKSKSNPKKS